VAVSIPSSIAMTALRRRIAAQEGTAVELQTGDVLIVLDPEGAQVADLFVISADDARNKYSGGRTVDYNATIRPTTGHIMYSNRSTPLLEIVDDTVGVHDVLLTPCSARMFETLRGMYGHASCLTNLASALSPYGIEADDIEATFNAFMNVPVSANGQITVERPASKPGDRIAFRAVQPVIVAVAACSSEYSNAGRCKPIDIEVLAAG